MPKKVVKGKLVLTHGQLKKQIVDFLRWHGWLVIPIAQGAFAYHGIADLYIIKYTGDLVFQVWIELKIGKDKQSGHQLKFETDIINQGGRYWVIRNLEDLKSCLRDCSFPEEKE